MYTVASSVHCSYIHIVLSQNSAFDYAAQVYVKETQSAREIKNLYASFKIWILAKYPTGEPSEEQWKEIITEDERSYHPEVDEDTLDNECEESNPVIDLDMQNDSSFDSIYYNIQSY